MKKKGRATKVPPCIRDFGFTTALAIILIVPSAHAQFQDAAPRADQPQGAYMISVDVHLVVLPITVRDRQGQQASDLQQSDFKVYEDHIPQQIRLFQHEDIPVIAGLLVDHSGSMQPKIAEVVAGARAFSRSSNPKDRMFVVNFNETVSLGLPTAIAFTANADQLEGAIWRAPAFGETALYDAIVKARTGKLPFLQSQASAALTGTTIAICLLGLWLPVSHFAPALNLVPLPHQYLLALLAILVAYLGLTQLVKAWLIRRFGLN